MMAMKQVYAKRKCRHPRQHGAHTLAHRICPHMYTQTALVTMQSTYEKHGQNTQNIHAGVSLFLGTAICLHPYGT